MIIYLSLMVAVLGALLYLLITPGPNAPKVAEMGRIAYFTGLLVFLWQVVGSKAISALR